MGRETAQVGKVVVSYEVIDWAGVPTHKSPCLPQGALESRAIHHRRWRAWDMCYLRPHTLYRRARNMNADYSLPPDIQFKQTILREIFYLSRLRRRRQTVKTLPVIVIFFYFLFYSTDILLQILLNIYLWSNTRNSCANRSHTFSTEIRSVIG